MMITLINLTMILLTTSMLFLFNPLMMSLTILINTLMICLISGMISKSFWFSYILFLTFLGGMLVMFIYMCSIMSNDLITVQKKKLFIMFTLIMMFYLLIINLNSKQINTTHFYYNLEMNELMSNFLFFNNENKINIMKLYNNQTFKLTLLLITYLLISLIAIVKIINNKFGSLRTL